MYNYDQLFDFAASIFIRMGCSAPQAKIAATALLSADLRGVDSHGVARLSGYVRLWEKGRIKIPAQPRFVHESPSTATLDGDGGLGMLNAEMAMQKAIEKAEVAGSGWVAVKNSNHFGIAGHYAKMALKKEMIGFAVTNASPLVAPTHSTARMLGTNPIAVAFPASEQEPFVLDMATTTAANGKLEILLRKNQQAPKGWIQDKDGKSITDPNGVKDGGALLPLGGSPEGGSHKGYGLGAMVDILSGVLSGANYGPWVPPFVAFLEPLNNLPGEGLGHFFGAMRVDAFRPKAEYLKNMDHWLKTFREAPTIAGQEKVFIPGDMERRNTEDRLANGIHLLPSVVDDLKSLAEKFSVSFPA